MACKVCGGSDEVEGDFVVYQYVERRSSEFRGAQQITTATTEYMNVKAFTFRACLQCTRSALLTRLRRLETWNKVLGWSVGLAVAGAALGGRGIYDSPLLLGPRVLLGFSLAVLLLAGSAWPVVFTQLGEFKPHAGRFPSGRVPDSEAMLYVYQSRIYAYAQSLNPTAYKLSTKWWSIGNFHVVSQQQWVTENAKRAGTGR